MLRLRLDDGGVDIESSSSSFTPVRLRLRGVVSVRFVLAVGLDAFCLLVESGGLENAFGSTALDLVRGRAAASMLLVGLE